MAYQLYFILFVFVFFSESQVNMSGYNIMWDMCAIEARQIAHAMEANPHADHERTFYYAQINMYKLLRANDVKRVLDACQKLLSDRADENCKLKKQCMCLQAKMASRVARLYLSRAVTNGMGMAQLLQYVQKCVQPQECTNALDLLLHLANTGTLATDNVKILFEELELRVEKYCKQANERDLTYGHLKKEMLALCMDVSLTNNENRQQDK